MSQILISTCGSNKVSMVKQVYEFPNYAQIILHLTQVFWI